MSLFLCCKVDRSGSITSLREKKKARRGDDRENPTEKRRMRPRPFVDQQKGSIGLKGTCEARMSHLKGTINQRKLAKEILKLENAKVSAEIFTFRQLAAATNNFNPELLLGEGGFGRVYKGKIRNTNQVCFPLYIRKQNFNSFPSKKAKIFPFLRKPKRKVNEISKPQSLHRDIPSKHNEIPLQKAVAVKQLDRNGVQGNREFLAEVLMLSLVNHRNLVNLIGYCADGHQRILVYEYMSNGSLEDHLLDLTRDKKSLNWITRMKIAIGAAQGLEYLHDTAKPPIIYRDFKASNILLDEEFNPKLSDFGLAKLGPTGDKQHVSTRVMGTYGYCAPEYVRTGQLTKKSDVYSFGVVFLEIITGRRTIDNARPIGEQNLVAWAEPLFKDINKFTLMADPKLEGKYPMKGLYQAIAIASMCLQEEAKTRPLISDVVTALEYLATSSADEIGISTET